MSEKRFVAEIEENGASYVLDNREHLAYGVFECADLLNALNEENKDLMRKLRVLYSYLLSDECSLTDNQLRKIRKELEE